MDFSKQDSCSNEEASTNVMIVKEKEWIVSVVWLWNVFLLLRLKFEIHEEETVAAFVLYMEGPAP